VTRVLLGYDGSDAARAAIAAAGALFPRAAAVVATVHPPPPPLDSGKLARVALPEAMIREGIERMRAETQERASSMAAEGTEVARAAGLDASPSTLPGHSAWRALRDAAQAAGADAVACGTNGEGLVGRVVLGSTASSLLHHADRALIVAPSGSASFDGPVLAGFDGSEGARAAIRFAAEHLRDRVLIVAHAWRSPVRHSLRGHAFGRGSVGEFADSIWREEAEDTAEEGAAYARELGLTASAAAPESGHGEWQTLLAGAREAGAAAVLVGSRGRGAVAATVLGSVASGLVHSAALPVLVVPQ
jgi:nucleotide-binding universal stress UspA family protein